MILENVSKREKITLNACIIKNWLDLVGGAFILQLRDCLQVRTITNAYALYVVCSIQRN